MRIFYNAAKMVVKNNCVIYNVNNNGFNHFNIFILKDIKFLTNNILKSRTKCLIKNWELFTLKVS